MKILRKSCSTSYPPIQNWPDDVKIPDMYYIVSEDLDLSIFYEYNGFVKLIVQNNIIISMEPDIEALNEWKKSIPIDQLPINIYKQDKISDLSSICNQTIINGFDIELSSASGHCSLTTEDQINISTAYNAILQGTTEYPYHLDGQLCQMFSANDIIKIAQTATAHKLYHTTYFNHLKAWVERCETQEEIDSIEYGFELPEDLANSMNSIINSSSLKS